LLFDWERYGLYLASLLVSVAIIRDLENALDIYRDIFHSTIHYEPEFCYYADALYKNGDYELAAEIGEQLHKRAIKYFKEGNPTLPLDVAGKAYRALIKTSIQNEKYQQAITYCNKLKKINRATANDIKVLEKLMSK